jgi:hypothetical protein
MDPRQLYVMLVDIHSPAYPPTGPLGPKYRGILQIRSLAQCNCPNWTENVRRAYRELPSRGSLYETETF